MEERNGNGGFFSLIIFLFMGDKNGSLVVLVHLLKERGGGSDTMCEEG